MGNLSGIVFAYMTAAPPMRLSADAKLSVALRCLVRCLVRCPVHARNRRAAMPPSLSTSLLAGH